MKCLEKKARWELHKDAVYHFEQILEEAPNKTAITSHQTNHPRKTSKTCLA